MCLLLREEAFEERLGLSHHQPSNVWYQSQDNSYMLTQQLRRVEENIPIPKTRGAESLLGDIIEDFVVEWGWFEVRYAD